jgi:hypothetical protein
LASRARTERIQQRPSEARSHCPFLVTFLNPRKTLPTIIRNVNAVTISIALADRPACHKNHATRAVNAVPIVKPNAIAFPFEIVGTANRELPLWRPDTFRRWQTPERVTRNRQIYFRRISTDYCCTTRCSVAKLVWAAGTRGANALRL